MKSWKSTSGANQQQIQYLSRARWNLLGNVFLTPPPDFRNTTMRKSLKYFSTFSIGMQTLRKLTILSLCYVLEVPVDVSCVKAPRVPASVTSDRVGFVCSSQTLGNNCCRWHGHVNEEEFRSIEANSGNPFVSVTFTYEAGEVEEYWHDMATNPESDSCRYYRTNQLNTRKAAQWMTAVEKIAVQPFMSAVSNSSLLSRYKYVGKRVDGKIETWFEWIEPLTGMTRNPFALCVHARDVPHAFRMKVGKIMDIDYLVLQKQHSLTKQQPQQMQHYLFDLGTSNFPTSLLMLICKYYMESRITFDEFYGWEARNLAPSRYWQEVSPLWMPKMHLYNIPIPANPSDPKSPLSMIQAIARPSDFVALKLDIDNTQIELAYFHFLQEHEEICQLVDEMFFEYHYESEIMSKSGWGHTGVGNLSQALSMFQAMRRCGVRLHFWP